MKKLKVLRNRQWLAGEIVDDPDYWFQERESVVTLQGKDLYESDTYWFVSDYWNVHSSIVCGYGSADHWTQCFNSKELAEQYIKNNKPVYPEGLVNELVEVVQKDYLHYPYQQKTADVLNKIKEFKQK